MRDIVTKAINAAGLAERADVFRLNASLQSDLAGKGLKFNKPDPAPFRETLIKAGFYSEWRTKYGEEAFAILEKSVGKLP
jgi:TRAP-type C4-dicarboxylate transport system substrate-binding protein